MLLELLKQGLVVTALDVDNALYMTSMVEQLEPARQRRAIFWGLLIELIGRLALIALFTFVISGTEPLFEIFGIQFTVESLSLLAAGSFLFVKSSQELLAFLRGEDDDQDRPHLAEDMSFVRLMVEMSVVSIVLSVDTIISIGGSTSMLVEVLYLLLFSAIVRLLFIRQIAGFMARYPSLNIIILAFLILIGAELFLQGLGFNIPEMVVNLVLLSAVIAAVLFHRQRENIEPV